MQDGFILSTVRRLNLRMLALSLFGLSLVFISGLLSMRYLINLLQGPAVLDRATLIGATNARNLDRYYVTITGDETADTGFSYVTTSDSGSESTDTYYLALLIDEWILLVESKEPEIGITVTGSLETIPDDVRSEVINTLELEVPETKGRFLPVMIDNSSFASRGTVGFILAGIVGLISLFGLGLSSYRLAAPEAHPAIQALSRYGHTERMVREIDLEMAMTPERIGNQVSFTKNWMVSTKSGLLALPYRDAIWCYKQVTQQRTNGIPTGKIFTATIYDRHGKQFAIIGKEAEVDQILQGLVQRTPSIVMGYTDDLIALWTKDRSRFIATVDQRRSSYSQ